LNAKKLGGKCLHVPQCGYGPDIAQIFTSGLALLNINFMP